MFHEFWSLLFHHICHQVKEKTLCLDNIYLPLCLRCAGIYSGFLFTLVYQIFLPTRSGIRLPPVKYSSFALVVFILLLLDIKFKQSIIIIPALESGLAIGSIIAMFLLPLFNRFLLRSKRDQSLLVKNCDVLWLFIIIFSFSRINLLSPSSAFWLYYFSSVTGAIALYLILTTTLITRLCRR